MHARMHAYLVKSEAIPCNVMYKHGPMYLVDSSALCSPLRYNKLGITLRNKISYLALVVEEQCNVQDGYIQSTSYTLHFLATLQNLHACHLT